MIHQHFKLVDVFSGTENIVLGMRNKKFNIKKAQQEIQETCDKYGFEIDLSKVPSLSSYTYILICCLLLIAIVFSQICIFSF